MSDPFVEHRNLLFRIAYDMLGSIADAEDVVQETYLRWSATERADVRDARAYVVRITTTQALNRLRSNKSRRETYIGPWLPEPLIGPDLADDVVDRAAREQQVSLAMLVVLETLSPAERAVFVLREVFGLSYHEVADALDRTPAAVRQLAHRAREHVEARRPRFPAEAAKQRQATAQFLTACATGDLAALMAQLAPDVTLISDGGGLAQAALRPIHGADKVARFLIAIAEKSGGLDMQLSTVNGTVGVVGFTEDGQPISLGVLDLDGDRVIGVYLVNNPQKFHPLAMRTDV